MSAWGGGTVLVAGPFPIHVDQINASTGIGPSALHSFHGWAGQVGYRQHSAQHPRGIELVHHGLDRMHGTHLVAMHAADEYDALARPRPLGNDHGHIRVLERPRLTLLPEHLQPQP